MQPLAQVGTSCLSASLELSRQTALLVGVLGALNGTPSGTFCRSAITALVRRPELIVSTASVRAHMVASVSRSRRLVPHSARSSRKRVLGPACAHRSAPVAVAPPNTSLQRTRRQSLRSFLLAAELDIVRRPGATTMRPPHSISHTAAVALRQRSSPRVSPSAATAAKTTSAAFGSRPASPSGQPRRCTRGSAWGSATSPRAASFAGVGTFALVRSSRHARLIGDVHPLARALARYFLARDPRDLICATTIRYRFKLGPIGPCALLTGTCRVVLARSWASRRVPLLARYSKLTRRG